MVNLNLPIFLKNNTRIYNWPFEKHPARGKAPSVACWRAPPPSQCHATTRPWQRKLHHEGAVTWKTQAGFGPRNVQESHWMEKYGEKTSFNTGEQANNPCTSVISQSMTILYKWRVQRKCLVMPVQMGCLRPGSGEFRWETAIEDGDWGLRHDVIRLSWGTWMTCPCLHYFYIFLKQKICLSWSTSKTVAFPLPSWTVVAPVTCFTRESPNRTSAPRLQMLLCLCKDQWGWLLFEVRYAGLRTIRTNRSGDDMFVFADRHGNSTPKHHTVIRRLSNLQHREPVSQWVKDATASRPQELCNQLNCEVISIRAVAMHAMWKGIGCYMGPVDCAGWWFQDFLFFGMTMPTDIDWPIQYFAGGGESPTSITLSGETLAANFPIHLWSFVVNVSPENWIGQNSSQK